MEGMEALHKRMRTMERSESEEGARSESVMNDDEDDEAAAETALVGSEEMVSNIQRILERMETFTQQVSVMLETGKMLLRDLSAEFEERLINVHKEQMEKWQDEVKELRAADAANEAARALLQNAQHHMLQNVADE